MNTETASNSYQHHHHTRAAENFFNVPDSISLINIVKPERLQNNPMTNSTEDENQHNNSETETKTSINSYHHHRAPRTPESYFNVPESIALLNIVKSERIQSAFQSNRKNHASVWEMVAEVLNRYSARKRSAKQCCNRYENLKKIYTQLKKNPERHVRRNWPYMFLFKEIEEQRGECWGSNSKRIALLAKNQDELSYYHRRRQAAEFGALLDKQTQAAVVAQHNLLQSLAAVHSNDSNSNSKLERFLPNHFVEAQLGNDNSATTTMNGGGGGERGGGGGSSNGTSGPPGNVNGVGANGSVYDESPSPLPLQISRKDQHDSHNISGDLPETAAQTLLQAHLSGNVAAAAVAAAAANNLKEALAQQYEKDCNGALNLQTNDNNNVSMKSEPMSDGEFNPDDIQLMQTNYNGSQNFYPNNMDHNILHPDVIVDTDNLTECSSGQTPKTKRKLSTSTDGDSTNYELIEYLKRREKRDEELLRRMDAREERLLNLLERTVVAIEALTQQSRCTHNSPTPPAAPIRSSTPKPVEKQEKLMENKLVNGNAFKVKLPPTNINNNNSISAATDTATVNCDEESSEKEEQDHEMPEDDLQNEKKS
ncbi:meso18E isoform X2 [Musca autumnalis]|uniref:meso18E isoform X2 n=2 Tax=Musca autumnalis TaxID=221902 RepID=UPI003CEE9411